MVCEPPIGKHSKKSAVLKVVWGPLKCAKTSQGPPGPNYFHNNAGTFVLIVSVENLPEVTEGV